MNEDDIIEEDIIIEEDESSLQDKIKKLQEKLKGCNKEKEEYLAGWQRSKADFINARREEEDGRKDLIKFSEENIIKELLILVDGFEAAFNNKELWDKVDKNWQKGMTNLYLQLTNILKSYNVITIESIGKPFNPQEHYSLGEIEVEGKNEDSIIIDEIQKGYKLHNKIIRSAKVKIGKYIK
jgi:molecular chaperone GrpE